MALRSLHRSLCTESGCVDVRRSILSDTGTLGGSFRDKLTTLKVCWNRRICMIAVVEHTSMQRLARSLSSTYTNFSVWTFPNSAYGTIVVNHVYRGLAAYRFERQDCDNIAIAIFCYIALYDGSVQSRPGAQSKSLGKSRAQWRLHPRDPLQLRCH